VFFSVGTVRTHPPRKTYTKLHCSEPANNYILPKSRTWFVCLMPDLVLPKLGIIFITKYMKVINNLKITIVIINHSTKTYKYLKTINDLQNLVYQEMPLP